MAGNKQGKSSKKDRQSVHYKQFYSKQYYRTYKNKENAWARHMKKHPNDVKAKENIKEARKNIKTSKGGDK